MAINKEILIKIDADSASAIRQLAMLEQGVKRTGQAAMNASKQSGGFFKYKGVGKMPGLGPVGGALGALGVGVGAAALLHKGVQEVIKLDTAMTDYRRTAGLSLEETLKYKRQVLDLGVSSGLATEKIIGLNQAAFDNSKNSKFVSENMGFMTKAFQAVGGDAQSFGNFMGKLNREMGLSGKPLEEFIGSLYAIGKTKGAEQNLQQIMGAASDLTETYHNFYGAAANPEGLKKYLAASMVAGPQAIQTAIRRMGTSDVMKKFGAKNVGMKLFTKDGAMRDLVDVLGELKTKMPRTALMQFLRETFGRGAAEQMLKLTDSLDDVNDKLKDTGVLSKDAAIESESIAAGWQTVSNAFMSVADAALGPALKDIAAELRKLSPEDIKNIGDSFSAFFKVLSAGVQTISTFVGAWKGMNEAVAEQIFGGTNKLSEAQFVTNQSTNFASQAAYVRHLRMLGRDAEADTYASAAGRTSQFARDNASYLSTLTDSQANEILSRKMSENLQSGGGVMGQTPAWGQKFEINQENYFKLPDGSTVQAEKVSSKTVIDKGTQFKQFGVLQPVVSQ